VAIEAKEAKEITDAVRPLVFVHTRPVARIVGDLFTGAVASHASENKELTTASYGGRTIYTFAGPVPVHWTRVGGELAVSSQKEQVQLVIDRAVGNDVGVVLQNEDFNKAVTRLPEGYRLFGYVNMAGYQDLVGKALGSQPDETKKALELTKGWVDSMAMAAYVNEDYTQYTLHTAQEYGAEAPEELKKLYVNADPQPAAWAHLPKSTFATSVVETDPAATFKYLVNLGGQLLGEDKVKDGLKTVGEQFLGGADVNTDLVAHLGASHGFGLAAQDRQLAADLPPEAAENVIAVPAAVVAMQVKDTQKFQATFVELIKTLLKKANEARGSDPRAVIGSLKTIATAQLLFREGDKDGNGKLDYGSLSDLATRNLIEPMLGAGMAHEHLFRVHISPTEPEFKWMAVASPLQPTEGSFHFAINHEGQVRYSAQRFELDDSCTLPKESAIYDGSPLPRPEVAAEESFRLVEADLAGKPIFKFAFPAKESKQQTAMLGTGFSPCFGFSESFLVIATSEDMLSQALAAKDGENVLASKDFQRVTSQHPKKVATFFHASVGGLIDQINFNGELAARNAAPAPESMKAPARPEFPEVTDPKKIQEVMDAYQKEQEQYQEKAMAARKKVAEWRKANATKNAAEMKRILDSARVLGDTVLYGLTKEDGQVIESVMVWQLDMDAAK
jgi:hypothetical protein